MVGFRTDRSGFGYVVAIDGLSALRDIETLPETIRLAAQRAINKTVDRTRTRASEQIRKQVSFKARYLDDSSNGRLAVSKRASGDDLEARITGRFRPTSLAQFVTSSGKRGVTVKVQPALARRSKRMFLIPLRAGFDVDAPLSNVGLAIRLKPGERVEHKRKMISMGKGLYLLYGPSVSQVFANVAEDVSPEAAEFLEREFLRLSGLEL